MTEIRAGAGRWRPGITVDGLRAGLGRPAAFLAGGPAPGGLPGSPSRSTKVWRGVFSGVWLLYLIQPAAGLFGHHHSWAYSGGGLAILAAFCVAYIYAVSSWERSAAQTLAGFGALFALAVVISLIFHGN